MNNLFDFPNNPIVKKSLNCQLIPTNERQFDVLSNFNCYLIFRRIT